MALALGRRLARGGGIHESGQVWVRTCRRRQALLAGRGRRSCGGSGQVWVRTLRQRQGDLFGSDRRPSLAAQEFPQLLAREEAGRQQRSLERRIHVSKPGRFKAIADFDFTWPNKIDLEQIDDLFSLSWAFAIFGSDPTILVATLGNWPGATAGSPTLASQAGDGAPCHENINVMHQHTREPSAPPRQGGVGESCDDFGNPSCTSGSFLPPARLHW
jgi:hypothetical protein